MPLSAESLVVIDVLQKSGVPPLIALPPADAAQAQAAYEAMANTFADFNPRAALAVDGQ
jgi:hypothetical protein